MLRLCSRCKYDDWEWDEYPCVECKSPKLTKFEPKEEAVKFKVGDRVRVLGKSVYKPLPKCENIKKGDVGTISHIYKDDGDIRVDFNSAPNSIFLFSSPDLELVEEEPVKTEYKVLKEISLLTLAQAGPKGCSEFRDEWHDLAAHMSKKGYTNKWTIPAGCTDGAVDDLIQWINEKPKRGKFGADKGFIERVEPELKPCPFCGLGAEIQKDDRLAYYVQCPCCHAMIDNYSETKNEAIEAWNRRA